ncbi:hypothetical protein ACWATR_25660 [Nostoc sp. UIC 10890]|jgi:hypothetical protein
MSPIGQYSSDKTKTLVETAIYRVSKTQNFCQPPLTQAYCPIQQSILAGQTSSVVKWHFGHTKEELRQSSELLIPDLG